MEYKAIKGTKDILPTESYLWQGIESSARKVFAAFGYDEIRTPIIEDTGLFIKSVGENTDIVSKEMFSFVDRGERNISLRPEGTAPVVRAYVENNLNMIAQFQKLFYIGPMFRAERPQAGRMRQFHQMGVEALGSSSASLDAEVIRLLTAILGSVGIDGYSLKINNLGCADDKKALSDALRAVFATHVGANGHSPLQLCEDCQRRAKVNPLRVLDCKNPNCRTIVRSSFNSVKFICPDCESHFNKVLGHLDSLNVKYTVDPYIVRGLDYYTKTVFEVTHDALGSQDAIGAGGRYDKLTASMGGPDIGACGFALGMERLLMVLDKLHPEKTKKPGIDIFITTLGEAAQKIAFKLADELRSNGISTDIDFDARSMKAQMRSADRLGARFTLIIGDNEINSGEAVLRNMISKEQVNIKFDGLVNNLKVLLVK